MRDTAQVVGLAKAGMVEVIPIIQDACLSCSVSGCAKRGRVFTVANPSNLPIICGMMVRVGASKRHQLIQTLVSIVIPLLCAVVSQVAIRYYVAQTQLIVSEGFKAFFLLFCFFISAVVIFFISNKRKLIQSEITEIVDV